MKLLVGRASGDEDGTEEDRTTIIQEEQLFERGREEDAGGKVVTVKEGMEQMEERDGGQSKHKKVSSEMEQKEQMTRR